MANRWGNSGNFILGGSKITADYDCSHEIKRHLILGRKAMTNLDSILKSRDIALPKKVHLFKAIVFPVVMYTEDEYRNQGIAGNLLNMTVKVESEKFGLKLNIQKMKIMASSPITSWQIDGETMETVMDYFFGLQNHCRW